jgi:hypothetical protein
LINREMNRQGAKNAKIFVSSWRSWRVLGALAVRNPAISRRFQAVCRSRTVNCKAEVLRWRYDAASSALRLVDSRLLLNCCGQRAMRVERIDRMVELTEKDEPDASDRRCDSVCAFDFTVGIPDVPNGRLYLKLMRDITDVQGSASLVWQGGDRPVTDVRRSGARQRRRRGRGVQRAGAITRLRLRRNARPSHGSSSASGPASFEVRAVAP